MTKVVSPPLLRVACASPDKCASGSAGSLESLHVIWRVAHNLASYYSIVVSHSSQPPFPLINAPFFVGCCTSLSCSPCTRLMSHTMSESENATLGKWLKEFSTFSGEPMTKLETKYIEASQKTSEFIKFSTEVDEEFSSVYEGDLKPIHSLPKHILSEDKAREHAVRAQTFYRSTHHAHILESLEYHASDGRSKLPIVFASWFAKLGNIHRILDFGCGIGSDALFYSKKGYSVFAMDLPGPTLEFAKWRVKQANREDTVQFLESEILTKDNLVPASLKRSEATLKFQVITAIECLMYFEDPVGVVRGLVENHLEQGGYLFFTVRFRDNHTVSIPFDWSPADFAIMLVRDLKLELIGVEHLWGPEGEKGKDAFVLRKPW